MSNQISIQQLCSIMYRKGMTFSKIEAAKIVGGRTRLERLVAEEKIRMEKKSERQNGRWRCCAGDVIYYAKYK